MTDHRFPRSWHMGLAGVIASTCLVFSGGIWCEEPEMESAGDIRQVASQGLAPRVTQASGNTISMDLVDANLEDVLKLLSQQAGLNFVAAEPVRDKRVTVYMDRVPIQSAIRSLLDANHLTFQRMSDGDVFIVTESGDRPIKLMTKVYTLKFARVLPTVGETVATFGNTGSLIKTGIQDRGGQPGGGAAAPVPGGGAPGLGGVGLGSTAENQGIVAIVKQILTEHGSATADPRTNSLVITDIPAVFSEIDAMIAKLDAKPAQVILEAEVLEVTVGTLRRLGIEYGTATGQLATFTGPSRQTDFPLGPTLLKRATSNTQTLGTLSLVDINAVLKALATERDVKLLASPRLMTLSNEVTEIRITTEAATGLTTTSQSQTGTITQEIERNTVGTILRVTPLVTDERYITMVIEPEVSRVVESSKFSSLLDPNRRAARTTVFLEDGGTAMIAGLLSQEREKSKRKIPFLGDLPLIGAPFRRSESSDTETEIVIFITPHIVRETGKKPVLLPIPAREQTPFSTKEQEAHRRYRQELLRQRRMKETLDLLAQP